LFFIRQILGLGGVEAVFQYSAGGRQHAQCVSRIDPEALKAPLLAMPVCVGNQIQHLDQQVDFGQGTGKGIEVKSNQAISQRVQDCLDSLRGNFRMALGPRLSPMRLDRAASGFDQEGAGATSGV
jgi:hypothetical protein